MKELYSNLRGYLYSNLSDIKWVFVFGLLFLVLFGLLYKKHYAKRRWGLVILSLNCAFIFVMTLFGRAVGETYRYALMPFESYLMVAIEGDMEMLLQILMNVAMYVPLGFLLPCCFKLFERYRYIILATVISSASIELIQGLFKIGLFEVDDIINNTLGAIIGLIIYMMCVRIRRHYFKESITNEK